MSSFEIAKRFVDSKPGREALGVVLRMLVCLHAGDFDCLVVADGEQSTEDFEAEVEAAFDKAQALLTEEQKDKIAKLTEVVTGFTIEAFLQSPGVRAVLVSHGVPGPGDPQA